MKILRISFLLLIATCFVIGCSPGYEDHDAPPNKQSGAKRTTGSKLAANAQNSSTSSTTGP